MNGIIVISTTALGNSIGSSKLESIAKHGIGHAYGISHMDFVGDLMSLVLTGGTDTSISGCDINGIEAVSKMLMYRHYKIDCKYGLSFFQLVPHPPGFSIVRNSRITDLFVL